MIGVATAAPQSLSSALSARPQAATLFLGVGRAAPHAVQQDLIITPVTAPNTITVDDLEVAQFIYPLLHNDRVRKVIDTVTSKVILILGRFTPERKAVLDAVRGELRKRDYLPIVFDFEKPSNRDLTETVSTLAHMASSSSRTWQYAKSLPQELASIVPFLPSVPVQPILLASDHRSAGPITRSARFARPAFHFRQPCFGLAQSLQDVLEHYGQSAVSMSFKSRQPLPCPMTRPINLRRL